MGWDWDFDRASYGNEKECMKHYTTPPEAVLVEGPIHAVSRRGTFGSTWWGQAWIRALESLGMESRLDRGRTYARNGSVLRMELAYGSTFARVQGTIKYCTYVKLKCFTDGEWKKALEALSGQAIYAAKLLAGEMPADIEDIFKSVGLSLFPRSTKDIVFDCSCPDYGDPCKHGAAVYYLLAEQLDNDPFLLFHMRGRSREQVLSALRSFRGEGIATEATANATIPTAPRLDADLSTFWTGQLPDLNALGEGMTAPVIPAQPPLLRQLGDPPDIASADLKVIYQQISEATQKLLSIDPEDHDEEIEK